jgi:hypothetical protein
MLLLPHSAALSSRGLPVNLVTTDVANGAM